MSNKTTTAVAVLPPEQEQQVQLQKVLKKIDSELKKLGGNTDYKPVASQTFKFYPQDQNSINMYTCTDINLLALMLGHVLRMKEDIENAYASLNITEYPQPIHVGAYIDNWIADLSWRLKLVSNANRIRSLNAQREELIQFTTKQQRLQDALEKTINLLKP